MIDHVGRGRPGMEVPESLKYKTLLYYSGNSQSTDKNLLPGYLLKLQKFQSRLPFSGAFLYRYHKIENIGISKITLTGVENLSVSCSKRKLGTRDTKAIEIKKKEISNKDSLLSC